MKIVDLQVIPFPRAAAALPQRPVLPEVETVQTSTKIITDEGAEGYYLGGSGHGDQDGLTAGQRRRVGGAHPLAGAGAGSL